MLSVNAESLFKLSGLSNIFLIVTAADNYICRLRVPQLKFDFKINGWCQFLNLKSSLFIT